MILMHMKSDLCCLIHNFAISWLFFYHGWYFIFFWCNHFMFTNQFASPFFSFRHHRSSFAFTSLTPLFFLPLLLLISPTNFHYKPVQYFKFIPFYIQLWQLIYGDTFFFKISVSCYCNLVRIIACKVLAEIHLLAITFILTWACWESECSVFVCEQA